MGLRQTLQVVYCRLQELQPLCVRSCMCQTQSLTAMQEVRVFMLQSSFRLVEYLAFLSAACDKIVTGLGPICGRA
jgi:hypothetical protein